MTLGAVKLGVAVLAPLRVTTGPLGWVHAKVSVSPFGSDDAAPVRFTVSPEVTVWSGPALATGGMFTVGCGCTVTTTVSVLQSGSGSQTCSENVRSVSVVTLGAVKLGVAVLAPLRVTLARWAGSTRRSACPHSDRTMPRRSGSPCRRR